MDLGSDYLIRVTTVLSARSKTATMEILEPSRRIRGGPSRIAMSPLAIIPAAWPEVHDYELVSSEDSHGNQTVGTC